MTNSMEQITASAGSGKTYTLTRRFLHHLAGAQPDGGPTICLLDHENSADMHHTPYSLAGILAATFTNKAATEMQARVIRELKQRALETGEKPSDFPLTPEQARHWIEVVLRRFDAINIRTIDSLLNLLVRLNALPLNLPPNFSPLFALDEALLPLYDALLDQADQDPKGHVASLIRNACRSLLFHHRAKGIAAGDILRKRLKELINLHLNGAPLPTEEDAKRVAAMLASLCASLRDAGNALSGILVEESLDCNVHALNFLKKCRECPPMTVPDFTDTYAFKNSIEDWIKIASKGKASDDADKAFHDFCVSYTELKKNGPALVTTLEYMPLVALIKPLLDGLETVQTEKGTVPAARLPSLALESLESGNGVSDAFCRLGDTLVHLLFDEFQDTSEAQWRAIIPLVEECLSRGGSLTYVGDVKQAIYGWRGGKAELFNAVARDENLTAMLPDNKAKILSLENNWRSSPAIVHTNNRIFGQLEDISFTRKLLEAMLPKTTNPLLLADTAVTLSQAFIGCRQNVPEKNRSKNGSVRLTRIEALYTSDLLEAVKDVLHSLLVEDVLTRRSPGEVAVLVRTNKEAGIISNWLAEWQVPVATENSFRLAEHPLITRLIDTLIFLEYPMDDAAFWSAVSSPELFGQHNPAPETLIDWLTETRGNPYALPLYVAYRKAFPIVWQYTLGPFLDQTGLLSAYDMVRELMRHCRLFERHPEQAPFLLRLSEVAHAAENKGISSLSAFLEYWAEAGAEERVPMPENMDAIRILTMHKAKGLEFPVVVAPFHHQAAATFKPLAVDDTSGIPLIIYRENSAAESIRAIAEQINLLYVAWTRPTEELYAFITQSGHSASHSSLGKALDILLESTPFTNDRYEYGSPPASKTSIPPSKGNAFPTVDKGLQFSNKDIGGREDSPLMAWLPRLKIFRNPLGEKGFSERQRGLLTHACLEALRLTGETQADVTRAVNQGLRTFPVPMPDPEAVRNDMEAVLAWYASLPEAIDWMRHGSSEQPIMDMDGSLRRIDLLVDHPPLPLLAVEYKTGQPSIEHTTQVERYLSLLAGSVRQREPEREIAGIIVYLDRRELVSVPCPATGRTM